MVAYTVIITPVSYTHLHGGVVAHRSHALLGHPGDQFLKGEAGVHAGGLVGLALLGDAGADEDGEGVLVTLFQHVAVGDHRRLDGQEVAKQVGIVLLDQRIDRRAAAGEMCIRDR